MDLSKGNKGKRKISTKALSDITNEACKKHVKKKLSKKPSKCNSEFKLECLGFSDENICQQKEYYVSLKEHQLFSLSSAVKVNTQKLKRRYKLLRIEIRKQKEKRGVLQLKIAKFVLEKQDFSSEASLCDTNTSSLKSFGNDFRYKQNTLSLEELGVRRRSIDREVSGLIEKEFFLKQKQKIVNGKKQKLIINYGKLYERKKNHIKSILEMDILLNSNSELQVSVDKLKAKLEKLQTSKEIKEIKLETYCKPLKTLNELSISCTKKSIQALESELSAKLESIKQTEAYLNDMFSIKTQAFNKIETILKPSSSKTKPSTIRALSSLSQIPKPKCSVRFNQ